MAHIGKELRLVLACLRELSALVLDFIEQTHVLDRDHRLIGKGCHQLDVLVVEWAHNGSAQQDHTDRAALAQKRYAEMRAKATQLLYFA